MPSLLPAPPGAQPGNGGASYFTVTMLLWLTSGTNGNANAPILWTSCGPFTLQLPPITFTLALHTPGATNQIADHLSHLFMQAFWHTAPNADPLPMPVITPVQPTAHLQHNFRGSRPYRSPHPPGEPFKLALLGSGPFAPSTTSPSYQHLHLPSDTSVHTSPHASNILPSNCISLPFVFFTLRMASQTPLVIHSCSMWLRASIIHKATPTHHLATFAQT